MANHYRTVAYIPEHWYFCFFRYENNEWNSIIIGLTNFIQAIYFFKYFWYKNAVQYNKLGLVIKIQSFWVSH
jgi:hypothetical protein